MTRPSRDPVGLVIIVVIGVGALIASSSYLAELAQRTGWTHWSSWILPLTVDALAVFGVRAWLRPSSTDAQRRTGRVVAWTMLAASVAGNATVHVLRAEDGTVGWTALVVLVGAMPPIGVFVAAHLYTLGTVPVPSRRSSRRPTESVQPVLDRPAETPTRPSPQLNPVPLHSVPQDGDELVARVRRLDADHRVEHGRPISRDKVRTELGCGNARASELLKAARAA